MTTYRFLGCGSVVLGCLWFSGCSHPVEDESVEQVQAYLTEKGVWFSGNSSQTIPDVSGDGHICALSGLVGEMGPNDWVHVYQAGDEWRIWGWSSGTKVLAATAACQPVEDFVTPADVLPEYVTFDGFGHRGSRGVCSDATRLLHRTAEEHAFLLQRIGGIQGSQDWIRVHQPAPGPAAGLLSVQTCTGSALEAWASIVDLHATPQFVRFGEKSPAAPSNEIPFLSGETRTAWLERAEEAFCYFTELGGPLRGISDYAFLNQRRDASGEMRWRLDISGARARVRCLALDLTE